MVIKRPSDEAKGKNQQLTLEYQANSMQLFTHGNKDFEELNSLTDDTLESEGTERIDRTQKE